jgi:hypothetical protein
MRPCTRIAPISPSAASDGQASIDGSANFGRGGEMEVPPDIRKQHAPLARCRRCPRGGRRTAVANGKARI